MRGVVLNESTLRISFLRAAALVLVSGHNGLCTDEAPDNESTSKQTSADNHEKNPTAVMEVKSESLSEIDIGETVLYHDTLGYLSNPNATSTMTAHVKEELLNSEEEPHAKRSRRDDSQGLWSCSDGALSREDQTSDDVFAVMEDPATNGTDRHENITHPTRRPAQAEAADMTPQYDALANYAAWLAQLPVPGAVLVDGIECDTGTNGIWGQQLASSAAPKHVSYASTATEGTTAAPGLKSVPVPPAAQTLKSSVVIMGRASTSDGVSVHPFIYDRLQRSKSSREVVKKERSTVYKSTQQLLLSPEGAKSIQRWSMRGIKTRVETKKANAPYLSSPWLQERLALHDKVHAYFVELQTAFECFGYDNVSIPDVLRRALDLAYTLKQTNRVRVSKPMHSSLQDSSVYLFWATEIVRDAFFSGRPVRPNLGAYLRNKLKIQNVGRLQPPNPPIHAPRQLEFPKQLKVYIRMIKRAINPKILTKHPLDFISFLNDVFHLAKAGHCLSMTAEGGAASRHTKQPTATTRQDAMIEECDATNKRRLEAARGRCAKTASNQTVAIMTKYKKLFQIDLAVEVAALTKTTPGEAEVDWFKSAVEEGYVPFDLLGTEIAGSSRRYTLRAHWLLGSIIALYRRLFESTDETSTPKMKLSPTVTDASDEGLNLNVVQEYLLQPLSMPDKVDGSTLKQLDPLPAASETLAKWKQDLKPPPTNLLGDIPMNLRPLVDLSAPFGTPIWILTQLVHGRRLEEHRNELHFVFDLFGHQPIDTEQVFARAFVLAETIITERGVPFEDTIGQVKLDKDSHVYVLAAHIIHAALFRPWPQRRDLVEYFAKQLRYEVLPQHKECLRKIMAKRAQWHPRTTLRNRKGDKEVVRDWERSLLARKRLMEDEEDNHPLSFDRFLKDVEVITKGRSPAIPAIASKYKTVFDRDIVEDLRTIRAHSPQICYNNSLVKGIEEGYVPYRYAKLLTLTIPKEMKINNNMLCLLGAHAEYFMSLVGPADPEVSQQIPAAVTQLSDDEVTQTHEPTRPDQEERREQLMAILCRAPPQKLLTTEVAPTKLQELHPVAHYLLECS